MLTPRPSAPIELPSPPWALITGASSGIGEELALQTATRGYAVVLVARRGDRLDALAGRISAAGGRSEVIVADLARRSAVRAIARKLHQKHIEIDLLINNAGVARGGAFVDMDADDLDAMVAVNVRALTGLTRALLPGMIERGRGRILNVASVAAFQAVPALAAYAASKAFVLSFSEALGEELRGTGVSVTALCPGLTKTDMLANLPAALPEPLIQTAKEVAAAGLAACLRGDAVSIPGAINQFAIGALHYQPRWLTRVVAGIAGRLALANHATNPAAQAL